MRNNFLFLFLIAFVFNLVFNGHIARSSEIILDRPISPSMIMPDLKGLSILPSKGLKIDFVFDGQKPVLEQAGVARMIRLFLAGLTFDAKDIWVNLSPYEQGRIMPSLLALTDLGDILARQDYLLKKRVSMLTHPDSVLGKRYWQELNIAGKGSSKAGKAFTKVWIVPSLAEVDIHGQTAIIGRIHLRVLAEEDYLAGRNNQVSHKDKSTEIIKSLIIPELEKEVNEGYDFAPLRQIFQALILAQWVKTYHRHLIAPLNYIDQNKLEGINVVDQENVNGLYTKYLQYYKKGSYNLIREDNINGQVLVQRYFSGGVSYDPSMAVYVNRPLEWINKILSKGKFVLASVVFAAVLSSSGGAQSREITSVVSLAGKGDVVLSSLVGSREFKNLPNVIRLNGSSPQDIANAVNTAVRKPGAIGITRANIIKSAVGQDDTGYFLLLKGVQQTVTGQPLREAAVQPSVAKDASGSDNEELNAFRRGLKNVTTAPPVSTEINPWGSNIHLKANSKGGETSVGVSYTQGAHTINLGVQYLLGQQSVSGVRSMMGGAGPCEGMDCGNSRNALSSAVIPSIGYHGVYNGFEAHGMLSYNTLMKEYMLSAGVDSPQTYNDGLSYQYGAFMQLSQGLEGFKKSAAIYLYGSYPIAGNLYASSLFVLGADDNNRKWNVRPIIEGRLAYDFNPVLVSAYAQYSPNGEIGSDHLYRNISMKAGFSAQWQGLEGYIETGRRYGMGSNRWGYSEAGLRLRFALYKSPVAPRVMNHGRPRIEYFNPDFIKHQERYVFRPKLGDSAMIARRALMAALFSASGLNETNAQAKVFFPNSRWIWQEVFRQEHKDLFCTVAADNLQDNNLLAPSHQFFTSFMYLFITDPSNIDILSDVERNIFKKLSNEEWRTLIFSEKVLPVHRILIRSVQTMLKKRVAAYINENEAKKIEINGIIFDPELRKWMNRWLLYVNYIKPTNNKIFPADVALLLDKAMTHETSGGIDFKGISYIINWNKENLVINNVNYPSIDYFTGMTFHILSIKPYSLLNHLE